MSSKNNWYKNIRTSLPYLKDVLVLLHEDVIVSMKDMSSSCLLNSFNVTSIRVDSTC
jgi:hypothetical protein